MEHKFYVYVLKDNDNNIFYVGKGCRDRNSSHRHNAKNNHQEPVYKKIRKLWKNDYDYKFEKLHKDLTHEEACSLEKTLIKLYGRKADGGILFNVTFGGEESYGYKHSPETIEKMKKSWVKRKQNYKISDETRKKLSIAAKNKKLSNEAKEKLSKSISGPKHWNYGNKGATEATLKMNEVSRKKINANGVVFNSITEAANHFGISKGTVIYRAKQGKNRGEKYGIWKYV